MINNRINRYSDNLRRNSKCGQVNLLNNILDHQNILNLFECADWQKEFPAIFSNIGKISEKEWNHLFKPIGDFYFSDNARRSDLIGAFHSLDKTGGLEVLESLFRVAFEDRLLAELLDLMNYHSGKLMGKNQIYSILNLIDVDSSSANDIWVFSDLLKQNSLPFLEEFSVEYGKVAHKKQFHENRSFFAMKVAERFVGYDFDNTERLVMPAIIKAKNSQQSNWLISWFNRDSMNYESFADIMFFPWTSYSEIHEDFSSLYRVTNDPRELSNCFELENGGFQEIGFSFDYEVEASITTLASFSRSDFFEKLHNASILSLNLENLCPEYKGDFFRKTQRSLFQVSKFFQNEDLYDLLQMFHVVAKNFEQEDEAIPKFFMKYLAGDLFEALNKLNGTIFSSSSKLYRPLFKVMQNLDPEIFNIMARLLNRITDPQNKELIQALGALWHNMSPQGKNAVFQLVDNVLLADKDHIVGVVDFALHLTKNLSKVLPVLQSAWNEKDSVRENTIGSFHSLATIINGSNVSKELVLFFSRKHLLKVAKIISRGSIHIASEVGSNYVLDPLTVGGEDLVIEDLELGAESSSQYAVQMQKCLQDVNDRSDSQLAYYAFIYDFPASCKRFAMNSFLWSFHFWLSQFENEYKAFQNLSDGDSVDSQILSPAGALSRENLATLVITTLIIDRKFAYKKYQGIDGLLGYLEKTLIHRKQGKTIENLLTIAQDLYTDKRTMVFANSMWERLLSANKQRVVDDLSILQTLFEDGHEEEERSFVPFKDCSKRFSFRAGFDPCYGSADLKLGLKRGLEFFYSGPEVDVPLISELVNLVHPAADFIIPYRVKYRKPKNEKNYLLTVKEFVWFLFDLSDPAKKEQMSYVAKNGHFKVDMDLLTQLEVGMREISFAGNFFNAYLSNEIAAAKTYKRKIRSLRRLMNLMNAVNFMPTPEQKRLIGNSHEVFLSLAKVDNLYGKDQGAERRYGELVQGILAALVKSSPEESQKFSGFRKPEAKLGEVHNVGLITEMVKLSALRHFASWIRFKFPTAQELESFVNSDLFMRINSQLLKRFSPDALKTFIESLFLAEGKEQKLVYELLDASIDFITKLDSSRVRQLEQMVFRWGVIVSFLKEGAENEGDLDPLLNAIVPGMKLVKELLEDERFLDRINLSQTEFFDFIKNETGKIYFGLLNKDSSKSTNYRKLIDRVCSLVVAGELPPFLEILTLKIREKPEYWSRRLGDLFQQIRSGMQTEDLVLLLENSKAIISDPLFDLGSLVYWFKRRSFGEKKDKTNSFNQANSDLLGFFLSEDAKGESLFMKSVNTIFVDEFIAMRQFVKSLLGSVSLKNASTSEKH